jgi:hypothetical protein
MTPSARAKKHDRALELGGVVVCRRGVAAAAKFIIIYLFSHCAIILTTQPAGNKNGLAGVGVFLFTYCYFYEFFFHWPPQERNTAILGFFFFFLFPPFRSLPPVLFF